MGTFLITYLVHKFCELIHRISELSQQIGELLLVGGGMTQCLEELGQDSGQVVGSWGECIQIIIGLLHGVCEYAQW